jgi:hypothetical protein
MSVYSTITLSELEAIEKIAEHLGISLEWNGLKKLEKRWTKQELLSMILFEITSKNPYSPNYFNNYGVIEGDQPISNEEKVNNQHSY